MSAAKVKEYLKKYNMDNRIITVPTTSATVKEAAEALGTEEMCIRDRSLSTDTVSILFILEEELTLSSLGGSGKLLKSLLLVLVPLESKKLISSGYRW